MVLLARPAAPSRAASSAITGNYNLEEPSSSFVVNCVVRVGFKCVGIAAAVATLVGYTMGLLYGSILRVLFTGSLYGFSLRVLFVGSLFGSFFGVFLGTTVLIILCLYMGPVDPQVDHYQAIQSILCCAYITTIIAIFIKMHSILI
jgi:hypothetical protein